MPAKRQSAFNRALLEAQNGSVSPSPAATTEETAAENQNLTQPSSPLSRPASAPAPLEEAPARNKGGRPRNLVAKRKFTYYLKEDTDQTLAAIKKALVRHADLLVDDKGEVVDQALSLMRFSLENGPSREAFLQLYQHWLETEQSKITPIT